MGIKHIIDTELKGFTLDLIIEGLNEIISTGNFTTALSETDNDVILSEDGDVVVNIVNDELNSDNCTLEENEVLKENIYKVYHGTNQKFSKFNFKNATQGIVWFTDSPESIEKGEHGGAGGNIIMTRYITLNKPAGWAEYEKYGLGQLQGLGYDGVILPQDNKTDYIVFSPKSISAKNNSENNKNDINNSEKNINNSEKNINKSDLLNEGLSSILYHFTYIPHLINILKYNKFATSTNLGSSADASKDKGKFFFFSTQRTKGMSGYAQHHENNVAIVLDGRKLNYTFKGFATDYWNWSKKRSDYNSIGDYTNALQSEENEDRIVTNKPYIDNANNYIIEIHIEVKDEDKIFLIKEKLEEIVALCTQYNIPAFFYDNEKDFKLQNKAKAIAPDQFNLEPAEKSDYNDMQDERDIYDIKWFFKDIAPSIIAGSDSNNNNSNNNSNNNERDIIEKLLKSALEKGGQPDQFDNVMQDINDKVNRLSSSWGRMNADDAYRSLSADIHNRRGDPNVYLRELLKMLINDMKKWGVKDLKEYFNKKFKAGIKENIENENNENDTNENMSKSLKNTHDRTVKFTKDIDPPILRESQGEFTNVFHGTSLKGAENIQKYGVKISKSFGGYFGWGFYTAIDYNLAKNNYAEFSDDNATDEKGVILEFKISPNANILDLRKEADFKTWLPYSKAINQPNLYQVFVKHGIDGLYDNSFEGVVIYNLKILTLVKLHYL